MIRIAAIALLSAAPSLAAAPSADTWHAKAREMIGRAVAFPTVAGRGQVPAFAVYLAGEYRRAGWPDADIRIERYRSGESNDTAALIVRWRAPVTTTLKPMLLLAHMDVVEARPTDWSTDPFKLVEKDGYLYGRGVWDDKAGVVGVTTALLKLRGEGFRPKRDVIVFFTGDEETLSRGAELGATEWRRWTDAEYALNADAGGGRFAPGGKPIGFGVQTAEKSFADYVLTVRNKGGHSSRPRADNAIYQLGRALAKVEAYSFTPALNETTRAYFQARQAGEKGPLGDAMRAWLRNPADRAAADRIESDEKEIGLTRTRCVATLLSGGHADNALPQLATATINCRVLPGVALASIRDELARAIGDPQVEVTMVNELPSGPVSPLRADVLAAYTAAVHKRHPGAPILPEMSAGATDAVGFRPNGVPVYGVDGAWGISPDDERAHGQDERLPAKALSDNVDHWAEMIAALAG